ncbi:MAG TPA: pyridoxamine 5'-phosphate oxidase family protein [Solirubrobacteraceae bacterium]|nr:pyridoxamine 5'-phosphate oxidase family protein [Solirubrobacteraceae bacterium]
MSRREQIRMSAREAASFLALERTVTCATTGPRGWPHLMPLWYVLRDAPAGEPTDGRAGAGEAPAGEPSPRVWAWTYGSSQKVRNLERDPRATLQVEAGEAYQELRGLMLECETVIHRDLDTVASLGGAILARNSVPRGQEPPAELPPEALAAVRAQAPKRVALEFVERRRASWDHRKLGGVH